jgi:hypothetical protein
MNASPAPLNFPKKHKLRVHQRETKPLPEGERGTDDECRARDRALGCDSRGRCSARTQAEGRRVGPFPIEVPAKYADE